MNLLFRSKNAWLILLLGFIFNYAALASDSLHPFRMSTDINAATMDIMGKKHPAKAEQTQSAHTEVAAKQGKVIESLQADDFSYLQVEYNSSKVWIAGIKTNVKQGDTVNYVENVHMDNFFSKTLNRTFKQIVFVSSISVVN